MSNEASPMYRDKKDRAVSSVLRIYVPHPPSNQGHTNKGVVDSNKCLVSSMPKSGSIGRTTEERRVVFASRKIRASFSRLLYNSTRRKSVLILSPNSPFHSCFRTNLVFEFKALYSKIYFSHSYYLVMGVLFTIARNFHCLAHV